MNAYNTIALNITKAIIFAAIIFTLMLIIIPVISIICTFGAYTFSFGKALPLALFAAGCTLICYATKNR